MGAARSSGAEALSSSPGASKGKAFNEEADRYLINKTNELGFGKWEELKYCIRSEPLFRFDWFLKSRQPQELKRRVDTLVRTIENEFEDDMRAKGDGGGEPVSKKKKHA